MRRAIRIRLRLLAGILFLFAFLLITRLYFVQVVHGSDYALRAEKQYISASQELFNRGTIYFTKKDGSLLSAATLTTGFTVAMNPEDITDAEATYTNLAKYLAVDKTTFMASADKKDDPYEVIAKRIPESVGRSIEEASITGIRVERERWRSYPAKTEAAQSIGFVAFDNDNSLAGRFGLERYYEDVLARKNEGLFGNFFAELFANLDSVVVDAREARAGDLVTTIDPVVQDKLDQVLLAVNAQYRSQETGGIIMDPKTGEIIAMDTVPSFDANDFANGDPAHFGNPLVEHRYEFGSIVKALTMTAGLDSGAITPETTYNDTGCQTLNNKKFCNYDLKARGITPMQEILSQSLNMGATFIALQTGHERFRNYFKALGMGEETGIDLPSEIPGDINNILKSPRDVEYATASFGQGIAQTPVEM
ncbi:MAG: penicillin-binding transpeptidase domain-containing protein, partial [Patescibacteria group bacterium]